MSKTYLGDGVYAEFDDFGDLWLTTENGISITNRICLEPYVLGALQLYLGRCAEEAERDE